MFSAKTVNVSGGIYTINESGGGANIGGSSNAPSRGFEMLTGKVSSRALHDSGEISEPPKCHSGTRVDILDMFMTWAMATTYLFPIKWLTGPAGAGKSAIVRSFAEMLFQQGLLLASFFFFRSDGSRNNASQLIPTLAYQICRAIPRIRPHVESAIDLDPLIFTSKLSNQIQKLIIDPLLHFFYYPNPTAINPFPRIILIDGLDECLCDETQVEILDAFCKMLQTLPIPIAIIIASRPECQIRGAFDLGYLNQLSSRIVLDDTFEPDRDIEKFYLDKFKQIQEIHPLKHYLPKIWPSPGVIVILVQNASGQFIYASTVIKFVRSIRHNPSTRLDMVLGLIERGTAKPFQQLDFLYATIFLHVEAEDLPRVLRVLGIILTPPGLSSYPFQSPNFLERLLGYDSGEVRRLFVDLESLLTVTSDRQNIRIFHTSLSDFLFDKSRAEDLSLDKAGVYADIAGLCIEQMFSDLYQPMMEYIHDQFPVSLKNATSIDRLHQMITTFDMKALGNLQVGSWIYGLNTLAPIFLDALESSVFPDAQTLHTKNVALFRESLSPKMKIYSSTQTYFFFLMLFLTQPSTASNWDGARARQGIEAKLASVGLSGSFGQDWLTEDHTMLCSASFFKLISEAVMEPNGLASWKDARTHCANLVAHLLPFVTSGHDNYDWRFDDSDWLNRLLPYLFRICPVRDDLAKTARDLLSKKLVPSLKEAIISYLESDGTPQKFGLTKNTALKGGSTKSSKKPIPRLVAFQETPRKDISTNSNSPQKEKSREDTATAKSSRQDNHSLTGRQPISSRIASPSQRKRWR